MNPRTSLLLLTTATTLVLHAQTVNESGLLGIPLQQPAASVLAQPGNEQGLRDRLGPVAKREGLSCDAVELLAIARNSRNAAAVDREHARLRQVLEGMPSSRLVDQNSTAAGVALVYQTGSGPATRLALLTKTNDVVLLGGCAATRVAVAPAPAAAAPAVVKPAGSGGIDGLYMRMVSRWNGKYTTFEPQHFVFRPDGRYLEGVPTGGLGNFDAACAKVPKYCGTYGIQGGKLMFQTAAGTSWNVAYERADGANLRLDGIFTQRVQAFAPGKKLAGKFTYLAAGSNSSGAGFLSGTQTFVFDGAGRFELSRVGTASLEAGNARASGQSSSGSSGQYELRGYELVLKFADGRQTTHTIYPLSDESKREIYNIDGLNFFRE